MNRSLWYAGLLVLAAGVTLTAVPGGYSTVMGGGEGIPAASAEAPVTLVATGSEVVEPADRSDSDTATSSPTAPGTEPGTVPDSATPTVAPGDVSIAALVNDVDTSVTVSYAASVDSDVVALRNPNGTVTIPEGRQQRLFARCAATEAGSGSSTLRVTIIRANVSDTTITDVELTTQFQYDCPGRERQDGGTTTA